MERLERAFALNLLDYARAGGGRSISCAGGVAAFLGTRSPLTTVKGAGPSLDDRDIDAAEEFFRDRTLFELAPWVPVDRLIARGYQVAGAENVVVRRPPFDAPEPAIEVTTVAPEDWPALQYRANDATEPGVWRALSAMCAALPATMRFGARDAACAMVMPAGDVAIFGNDATASAARGRGLQAALVQARLRAIAPLGFAYAAAEVEPGGVSERNYLRCGFELAYRRTWYARIIRR